jgi:hypothetical protein
MSKPPKLSPDIVRVFTLHQAIPGDCLKIGHVSAADGHDSPPIRNGSRARVIDQLKALAQKTGGNAFSIVAEGTDPPGIVCVDCEVHTVQIAADLLRCSGHPGNRP